MNPGPLPPELQELENRLRSRYRPGPSVDPRVRIMQVVGSDLSFQTPSSSSRNSDGWYWAAIAAAAIIVMNLSLIDAARTEFSRGVGISPTAGNVEPLRKVLP